MPRSRIAPRQRRAWDWQDDAPVMTGQTVIEDEGWREPQHTGLLDRHSNPIVRLPEPVGFLHAAEDD